MWRHQNCFNSHSRGTTGDFSLKRPLDNNFSTGQPISANSIPIDSARQVEKDERLEKCSNIIRGEQPGNFHINCNHNDFSTGQTILTNSKLIDSIRYAEDYDNVEDVSIFNLGGATVEFSYKKYSEQ